MKYFFLILFILIVSCKKDSTNQSGNYYFNCDIDGKHIQLNYATDNLGVPTNGVYLQGYATSIIHEDCESYDCGSVGTYCVTQVMEIQGQTTGTYTPDNFIISFPEGAETYIYTFSKGNTSSGSMSATITNIDHEPSNDNNRGFLQGTFTGTIDKVSFSTGSSDTSYSNVTISGSFSTPLN